MLLPSKHVSNGTHLSVSLELHVEQLKHLTHQALFSADTTKRQKRIKHTRELQILRSLNTCLSVYSSPSPSMTRLQWLQTSPKSWKTDVTHIQIMSRTSGTVQLLSALLCLSTLLYTDCPVPIISNGLITLRNHVIMKCNEDY